MITYNDKEFGSESALRIYLLGQPIIYQDGVFRFVNTTVSFLGEVNLNSLRYDLTERILKELYIVNKEYCGLIFSTKEELIDLLRKQPLSYKDSRLTLLDVTIVTTLGVNDIEKLKETIISIIVNKVFLGFVYKDTVIYGTKVEIKEQVFKIIGEEIDNL